MSNHERHTPPDNDTSASEPVVPPCRTVPEPASHRRPLLLSGRRIVMLAALGTLTIPLLVVGAINGLDRSSASGLSPQSKQRPDLPDGEESGTAHGDRSTHEQASSASTRPAPGRTRAPGKEGTEPTDAAESGSGTGASTLRPTAPSSTDKPRESTRPTPSPAPSSPDTIGVLRQGDSGPAVAVMQHLLYQLGFYHGHRYGHFDDQTEESVRRFQTWAAVADEVKDDAYGTYGPATRAALLRWAS
jgi:hypothetical protein